MTRRTWSSPARISDVKTSRSELADSSDAACTTFGGTTLYAKNQEILAGAINRIREALLKASSNHLILPRPSLNKVVRDDLGEELDSGVFGAVLGRLLSLGDLEGLITLTVNSRNFCVFVKGDRVSELYASIAQAEALLREKGTLSPREVQNVCFPQREWGTYVASKSMLGHLAYLGKAVFMDQELFAWPQEVENALRKTIQ